MKNILLLIQRIKKHTLIAVFLLLLFSLIVEISVTSTSSQKDLPASELAFSMEYIEDESGKMTLEDVRAEELSENFISINGSTLSIGQSLSTWWLRLKLQDGISDAAGVKYLSINNPTVEKLVLYLPADTGAGVIYKVLRSGWGFQGNTQDEGYSYPVFDISKIIPEQDYIYIQLKSPFTQSYSIEFLKENDLIKHRQKDILIIGILFGILIAVGILNLINFAFMKDKAYIFYAVYILFVLSDQIALLGIFRLFSVRYGDALTSHVVTISFFMLTAAILFCRSFLDMKKSFPKQDNLLKPVLLLIASGIMLMLFELRFEGSVILSISGVFSVVIMVWTAYLALRKGLRQARYFFAGWSIILTGMIIFSARVWGIIPTNYFTLNSLLISAVAESILLSAALTDRVRVLRDEKDKALLLYKNAEENSRLNEMAFLQAQIKPHFLYNSLNVIAALCRLDAEKARSLLLDLSSYLHHTFSQKKLSQLVPFEEELEYIKAYVNIEQARFRDKVNMEYELKDTQGLILPPLILQPLVENAIRHGIRKSEKAGKVILRVKKDVDVFVIEVEDNGVGMSDEQLQNIKTGVGLANIQRRLQMLYGNHLTIQSRPGEGTKVTLIIPKRKETV